MLRALTLILPTTLIMVSPAFAHTGVGDSSGLAHGFMHPVGGTDHVLAMVAVGLFAALLGGRALWLVPASFVGMTVVGGALGMAGVSVPFVEIGIGLSVVVLGAVVALRLNLSIAAAMALAGFFAIFHGYAHGAEMPDTASGFAYGAGFVLATAMLHVLGICLGLATQRMGRIRGPNIAPATGGMIALAGVALLAQMI
jgi:urease accessory protein